MSATSEFRVVYVKRFRIHLHHRYFLEYGNVITKLLDKSADELLIKGPRFQMFPNLKKISMKKFGSQWIII